MNSIRNGLGMRETEVARETSRPWNPHFYAIFAQVHNTLLGKDGHTPNGLVREPCHRLFRKYACEEGPQTYFGELRTGEVRRTPLLKLSNKSEQASFWDATISRNQAKTSHFAVLSH